MVTVNELKRMELSQLIKDADTGELNFMNKNLEDLVSFIDELDAVKDKPEKRMGPCQVKYEDLPADVMRAFYFHKIEAGNNKFDSL